MKQTFEIEVEDDLFLNKDVITESLVQYFGKMQRQVGRITIKEIKSDEIIIHITDGTTQLTKNFKGMDSACKYLKELSRFNDFTYQIGSENWKKSSEIKP